MYLNNIACDFDNDGFSPHPIGQFICSNKWRFKNNSFHIHPFQRHTYIDLTSSILLLMWQTNKKVCLPMTAFVLFYATHPYGRRIGTRMLSIEWCHLQWSLMTSHLYFKVTIFWTSNNSKMVQDNYIVTMGTDIKSYTIYDSQWPWITPNPDFKVTLILYVEMALVWRSATRRWILLTYARQFLLWAYFTYLLWLWILCVGLF